MSAALLHAKGVSISFGGLKALQDVHLELRPNEVVGVIGPNGAGKTTFFNLLTGFDQPNSGDWSLNGKSLKGIAPHKVSRMGMVRTFQLTKALFRLSVLDNMRLGARDQIGEGIFRSLLPFLWKKEEEEITARSRELLTRFKRVVIVCCE